MRSWRHILRLIPEKFVGKERVSTANGRQVPDALALWILFSCFCSLSGWSLSLLRALNAWGYGIALLVFIAALTLFGKTILFSGEKSSFRWKRPFRSRRLLPKIWLCLALLVFIGGLLYHPVNYDYLTYRFPRVLYWSWEQSWCWIQAGSSRMNYSGTGFEWLMTPQFILLHTDRLFFLINFVSFLFLPALVFSVFRQLGISPRVCWWWMWVLPCGYCYILQACGTGNDSFATVYLLASLHYAFKARTSPSPRNLVLSLLAIGLLTGAKASNLPLVLPWLIAVLVNRRPLFAPCPAALLAPTLVLAAVISFLPVALLNLHFTDDYSGDPSNLGKMKLSNPISGLVGNSILLAVDNLSPPLWYKPITWSHFVPAPIKEKLLPAKEKLLHDFPRLGATTGEMVTEEGAGVGLGVVVAVVFMLLLRLKAILTRSRGTIPAKWIAAAGFIALLVYMSKIGSESAARLVAAYYPLLIAGILIIVSLDGAVIRRTLCQIVASIAMLSAAPLIILSPTHPLFPTRLALNALARAGAGPGLIQRSREVYETYANRYDSFYDLRVDIPEREKVVGFIHLGDDPEVSLWLPFGSRKVVDVHPEQSLAELQALHLHYVIVDKTVLVNGSRLTIDDLLNQWSATVVAQKTFAIKIQRGPELWYLLHIP